MNNLDLQRYVPALLNFTANKLSAHAARVYKERFQTSITEWRILSMIAVEPGIKAQGIIEYIGMDKAAVSRNVKLMSEKGWLQSEPDADDLRAFKLYLTDEGTRLHDDIMEVAIELEQQLLAGLNRMEIENLIYLLGEVHKNAAQLNSNQ